MLLQSKGVQAKAYDTVLTCACQGIANPGTTQSRQTSIFYNVNDLTILVLK